MVSVEEREGDPAKEKAKIIVNFNTQTVYDRQDRLIQIFSNDKNSPATLRFKGVVINK